MISSALVDIVKLSLMPRRLLFLYCLVWGVVGGISIIILSKMTRDMIAGDFNLENFIILEWIEILIMFLYLFNFNKSRAKRSLKFYPGFMIAMSIFALSFYILTEFSGFEFGKMALMTGIIDFFILCALGLMLKRTKTGNKTLYSITLFCAVITIITFGFL